MVAELGESSSRPSGGGATDIALYGINKSADWNNSNHLYSRIIVAGGGAGAYRSMNSRRRRTVEEQLEADVLKVLT